MTRRLLSRLTKMLEFLLRLSRRERRRRLSLESIKLSTKKSSRLSLTTTWPKKLVTSKGRLSSSW